MKLLGTVKGKIIAGVVAVGLVSSAGVAFANTSAGDMLKEWYEGVFNETVDAAKDNGIAYAEERIPQFLDQYNDWKDHSAGIIERYGEREAKNSTDEINTAKNAHVENVESTKEEIIAGMGLEFNDIFVKGVAKIEEYGAEATEKVTNDLNDFGDAEGQKALDQVTEDLNEAKAKAISDLEEAIEGAKGDLSSELDDRGENLAKNFRSQIHHEIEGLLTHVSNTLDELEKEQKTIIADHAQKLENDAKDALDAVVAGMNN